MITPSRAKAKKAQLLKPWFWWIMLAISMGAVYILTSFQIFTGEHTVLVIRQITGLNEPDAYLMNAIARKSAHVLIYGFLAILFYRVIRKRSIWYAWLCTLFLATLDEWLQSFVPGRTPSGRDVVLDSIAAFIFLLGIVFFRKRR
ncbi:VanZ family protein [Paenibacillus eucommiae]|uniref:VanZ family protein n=1 Tax=Paenibacillus eucommiae TaxID=1355755 RepID=UPI0035E417E4